MLYPKHKLLGYKWGGLGNHDFSFLYLTFFTEHKQFKICFWFQNFFEKLNFYWIFLWIGFNFLKAAESSFEKTV